MSTPTSVKLPTLYVIPARTKATRCACGRDIWFVMHEGKRVPISVHPTIPTKAGPVTVPGVRAPVEHASDGFGYIHFIDCDKRRKFEKPADPTPADPTPAIAPPQRYGPPTSASAAVAQIIGPPPSPLAVAADDYAARVRAAEALAQRWDVRCTGSPGVPEQCNGWSVAAFLLGDRLFAAPCSACADRVQRLLKYERPREWSAHALNEYLVDRGDDVARKFAARVAAIREWNKDHGVQVPARGTL